MTEEKKEVLLVNLSPEIMVYVGQFGPLVVMLVLLYFLFIRPQKQEQQKRQSMLDALKKGDRVITIGGMHGTIVDINEKTVVLKAADKIELKFQRSAIQNLFKEEK
jgi:preprotein translocase subunit YajC